MSDSLFRVALIQACGQDDQAANVALFAPFIKAAAQEGAGIIFLPEVANLVECRRPRLFEKIRSEETDPFLAAMQQLAAQYSIYLHIGSLALQATVSDQTAPKAVNRSLMIDPEGEIITRYDKIHLFDVNLSGGETYRESDSFMAGEELALAPTSFGKIGMTICYDVRFPILFRKLVQAGAGMIAIPAAFTQTSGQAHWHTLIRARAIENSAFIFAAAQSGSHADGRQTYGHSLVVDPWGRVLADGGTGAGPVYADIDPSLIKQTRQRIPAVHHDRLTYP